MKKHLLLALLCAFGLQTAQAADPGHYGIICYHDIIDTSKPEDAGVVRRQYFPQTLTADRLIAHFNWLRDNGYTPVSWQQIKDARAGKAKLPDKPVLLTFDDGYLPDFKSLQLPRRLCADYLVAGNTRRRPHPI